MAGLFWGMSSTANAAKEQVPVIECLPVAAPAKNDPDVEEKPLRPAIGNIYVPSIDTHLRDGAVLRRTLTNGKDIPYTKMRELINNSYAAVDSEHRAMENCWRSPLSRFGDDEATDAAERGVPKWARDNVFKAKNLINETGGFAEQVQVYDSQIQAAAEGGQDVNRVAILKFLGHCDDVTSRLHAHLPLVQKARAIFDNPAIVTQSEDPQQQNREVALSGSNGVKSSDGKDLTKMIFGGLLSAAGVAASIVLDTTLDVMAGKTANGTDQSSSPQQRNTHDQSMVDPVMEV